MVSLFSCPTRIKQFIVIEDQWRTSTVSFTPILAQCRASVDNAGPALDLYWFLFAGGKIPVTNAVTQRPLCKSFYQLLGLNFICKSVTNPITMTGYESYLSICIFFLWIQRCFGVTMSICPALIWIYILCYKKRNVYESSLYVCLGYADRIAIVGYT